METIFDIRRFTDQVDDRSKAAGILPFCINTGRFLVCMSVWESKFSTVGGYLTWGEEFEEAALREFVEETMYTGPLLLVKGYHYSSPAKSFEYVNYVGLVPEEFKPDLDKENSDAEWVSISQLYAGGLPLLPEFEHFIIEARPLIDNLFEMFGLLNQ